jgi:hypothetical protein
MVQMEANTKIIVTIFAIFAFYISPLVLDYYLAYDPTVREFRFTYVETECEIVSVYYVVKQNMSNVDYYDGHIIVKYSLANYTLAESDLTIYENCSDENHINSVNKDFPKGYKFSCFYKSDNCTILISYDLNFASTILGKIRHHLLFLTLHGVFGGMFMLISVLVLLYQNFGSCKTNQLRYLTEI